jgi:hypothetical protein
VGTRSVALATPCFRLQVSNEQQEKRDAAARSIGMLCLLVTLVGSVPSKKRDTATVYVVRVLLFFISPAASS